MGDGSLVETPTVSVDEKEPYEKSVGGMVNEA